MFFQRSNSLTMSGLEVGNKALFTPSYLAELQKTHGSINDFVGAVFEILVDLTLQYGGTGATMYDPSAVAIAIDPSFVRAGRCTSMSKPKGDLPAARLSETAKATWNAMSSTATTTN